MALPLPQVVYPGGPILGTMNAINNFSGNVLKNQNQALQNQFYGPNIQSEMGYRNALMNAQNIRNQYLPQQQQLENAFNQMRNQNYVQDIQSQINSRNAMTGAVPSEIAQRTAETNKMNQMLPGELTNQQNINKWYGPKAQADINYMNMGGGRGSTGGKDDWQYVNQVGLDNKQLGNDPDKIREAANVLSQGGNQLSDGTKLNAMSPSTQRAYDRAYKSTSSAKLVTAGVQANQADAELTALNNHVMPVIKDVGTTYAGRSPDQIIASFKSDDESQKKLGRIIGARSLQYAIAQLRNRIDMGEPGINATRELMDNSGQIVNVFAPRLTGKAREEAQNFINEGVVKALKERNKYGIGASGASGKIANTQANNQQQSALPQQNQGQTPQVANQPSTPNVTGRWERDASGKLMRVQ